MMTPKEMMSGLVAECEVIVAQRDRLSGVSAVVESTTNRIAILASAHDFIRDHANANIGDPPSIAESPAMASSAIPEPPASDREPDGEPTNAQAPVGSPKYRARMTVTGTWMSKGQPKKRVIQFHADESECGDLLTLLFDIERAINNSASAYSLRAHVTTEEA